MVYNNETVSSTGNSAEESPKTDAEVEWKNLPVLPPGFYFVPSPCVLILEFLVKKIKGADLASDMVKVRDGVQLLDPEQHRFKDDFTYCQDNEAYYITNKAERKTGEGGAGSKTSTIIKTTSGYWREKKKDVPIYNGDDQVIGHKKGYIFCRDNHDETSWRMDEFTVNPEILPTDARDQIKETIACRIRMKQPKAPEWSYLEAEESESEEDEETENEEAEIMEVESVEDENDK